LIWLLNSFIWSGRLFVLELRDLTKSYILADSATDLNLHIFVKLLVEVASVSENND